MSLDAQWQGMQSKDMVDTNKLSLSLTTNRLNPTGTGSEGSPL